MENKNFIEGVLLWVASTVFVAVFLTCIVEFSIHGYWKCKEEQTATSKEDEFLAMVKNDPDFEIFFEEPFKVEVAEKNMFVPAFDLKK